MSADLCPATGERHAWVYPVVQSPPDSNYPRYSYRVQGQFVRGEKVRCWDCKGQAPTGTGTGED